jgi:hypothetical protein
VVSTDSGLRRVNADDPAMVARCSPGDYLKRKWRTNLRTRNRSQTYRPRGVGQPENADFSGGVAQNSAPAKRGWELIDIRRARVPGHRRASSCHSPRTARRHREPPPRAGEPAGATTPGGFGCGTFPHHREKLRITRAAPPCVRRITAALQRDHAGKVFAT